MPKAQPPSMPAVDAAFGMIEQAVRLIAMARPEQQAAKLRRAIDSSFYVDPTLAQRYLAQKADMDRKIKILDDAARLVSNWQIVEVPNV